MTITQEVLDALPETGGIGRHLPALALFSKDSMVSCQGFHKTPGIKFGLVGVD